VQENVRRASQGGDGWSEAQFAAAAVLVLDTKHNAVLEREMRLVIGAAAVRALVKANVFSVRPYSEWALDVNEAAFAPAAGVDKQIGKKTMIITAAAPVYLYCMREERQELQAVLQLQTVRKHDKNSAVR
jgi:hypothetical protein